MSSNPTLDDDRAVRVATRALLALGALLALISMLLLALGPEETGVPTVFAAASLGEGLLKIGLSYLVSRHSRGALLAALILTGLGLVVAALGLNVLGIVVQGGLLVLLNRAHTALQRANERIDHYVEERKPMVTYYHHLIPLLVHVMKADGHVDRREERKIREVCDRMRISGYGQQRLVERARRTDIADLQATVDAYADAADGVKITARWALLDAAIAVAGADGAIVPEEAEAIRELGALLGLPPEQVLATITAEEQQLADMSPSRAREVLGLGLTQDPDVVRRAYEALAVEVRDAAEPHHLGRRVEDAIARRLTAARRTYEVLTGKSSPVAQEA